MLIIFIIENFCEYVAGVWWCIAVCKADEMRHWGVLYQSVWLSIKIVISTLHNIDFLLNVMFGNFGVFLWSAENTHPAVLKLNLWFLQNKTRKCSKVSHVFGLRKVANEWLLLSEHSVIYPSNTTTFIFYLSLTTLFGLHRPSSGPCNRHFQNKAKYSAVVIHTMGSIV